MIVGAIGSLATELAGSVAGTSAATGTTPATPAGGGASEALGGLGASSPAGSEALGGVGASSPAGSVGPAGVAEAPAGESGFGSQLAEAISSLEGTQRGADAAAQSLATGTAKDPESAVTTVEDASLAMQLAAQIRAKATEAAQTIFQTQV